MPSFKIVLPFARFLKIPVDICFHTIKAGTFHFQKPIGPQCPRNPRVLHTARCDKNPFTVNDKALAVKVDKRPRGRQRWKHASKPIINAGGSTPEGERASHLFIDFISLMYRSRNPKTPISVIPTCQRPQCCDTGKISIRDAPQQQTITAPEETDTHAIRHDTRGPKILSKFPIAEQCHGNTQCRSDVH